MYINMNKIISCLLLLLACSFVVESALPTGPLKVVYLDYQIDWSNPLNTVLNAVKGGYNVVVLGFYITGNGPADMATSWASADPLARQALMNTVHSYGAVVLISLGGATDGAWTSANPTALGTQIGTWARQFNLDGVDFDLEYPGTFAAVGGTSAATVTYFATLATACKAALGAGGIVSFAPVAPWFGPLNLPVCTSNGQAGCTWVGPTGGMTGVYKQAPNAIDYFFIQFYNQGSCYTTQAGLFTASGPGCDSQDYFPLTSVAEIAAGGVPLSKLVVGKPVNTGAATTGFVDPALLHSWIASSGVGIGGSGIWFWESAQGTAALAWLASVYPGSSTVTAGPVPTSGPTSAPQPTSAPTARPSSGPTARPTLAPTSAPGATPLPTAAPGTIVTVGALTYPLKVVYIDYKLDWSAPQNTILNAVRAGYNVIVMGFYLTGSGPTDMAQTWASMGDSTARQAVMNQVHAAGAVVLVSLGGATDSAWKTADPTVLGTTVGNWAKQYQLDGVDFDLENSGTFAAVGGTAAATVNYLATISKACKAALGPNGIISHAPVAPWFGPVGTQQCTSNGQTGCTWVGPSGGMTAVYQQASSAIDFFFIQFYNQGTCYTTEAGLFIASGPGCTDGSNYYPQTALKEIAAGGIPMSKLVIGKPVDVASAGSGFVLPATLGAWIQNSGASIGWNAGSGIWMWDSTLGTEAVAWLQSVYPGSGPSTARPGTLAPSTSSPSTAAPSNPTAPSAPSNSTSAPYTGTRSPSTPVPIPTEAPFDAIKGAASSSYVSSVFVTFVVFAAVLLC